MDLMAFSFDTPPARDDALRDRWLADRADFQPGPECRSRWWEFWKGDPHDWALIPGTSMDGYCTRCDARSMLRTWMSSL